MDVSHGHLAGNFYKILNFNFVLPLTNDITAIIWRTSFFVNILEWAENSWLLKGSIRHEQGYFMDSIDE